MVGGVPKVSTDSSTDSQALIGTSVAYKNKVELQNYVGQLSATSANANISYVTACTSPTGLTYTNAGVEVNYSYAYTGSALAVTPPTFTVTPSYCKTVTYTCTNTSRPAGSAAIDCATASVTTFNTATGAFTFTASSSKFATYPPGEYKFTIKGSSGSTVPKTADYKFKITLPNLCSTATLSFKSAANPTNKPLGNAIAHKLKDAAINRTFTVSNLVQISPAINCGTYTIEFYDNTSAKTLTSLAFSVDTANTPNKFTVLKQENSSTIGSYSIYFSIKLTSYPTRKVDSFTTYSSPALTVTIAKAAINCTPGTIPEAFDFSCDFT